MTRRPLNKIYEVRSLSRSDGKLHFWGARPARGEATSLLRELTTGDRASWAHQYHERWWIEEIDTTGLFELPAAPPPRERFTVRTTVVESPGPSWNTLHVEVRDADGVQIASFDRNHPALHRTFEPFRQGARLFALVSPEYTTTAVLDLATGQIIASESPDAAGFCPVGFYVPDWWDVHDGSILPGSGSWRSDFEEPRGDFGFVWGCVWGDDSSWKVQYLDLTQVREGKLRRDDRFGYLRLAERPELEAREFIRCSMYRGEWTVTFAVHQSFALRTGARIKEEDL